MGASRSLASTLFSQSISKRSTTQAHSASTSARVRPMIRAPQRSVNWWTGSERFVRFRSTFSAKLVVDFTRVWTIANGAIAATA